MTATATDPKKSFEQFSKEWDAKKAKALAWAKEQGYTLSGVKVLKMSSEETLCFEASILKNGKKVGFAHNSGQGGPTMVEVDYKKLGLNNETSEYLEIFADDEAEHSEDRKWEEAQGKRGQKQGASFVLIYKNGPEKMAWPSAQPTLEEARAEAIKKGCKGKEVRIFDFSATAAQVREQVRKESMANWRAKTAAKFKKLGAKAMVFFDTQTGQSARAFYAVTEAQNFAKTVKNPETVTL